MSFVFEGVLPRAASLAMFSRLDASWHPVSNDNEIRLPGAPIRPPDRQNLPWVGKVDPVALSEGVGEAIRARLMEVGSQLVARSLRDGAVAITNAPDDAALLAALATAPEPTPEPVSVPDPEPAPDAQAAEHMSPPSEVREPATEDASSPEAVEPVLPTPPLQPLPVRGLFRYLETAMGRIETSRRAAREAIVDKLAKPIAVKRPGWLFGRYGVHAKSVDQPAGLARLVPFGRRGGDNTAP